MPVDMNRLSYLKSGNRRNEPDTENDIVKRIIFVITFFVILFMTVSYLLAMVLFVSVQNQYFNEVRVIAIYINDLFRTLL